MHKHARGASTKVSVTRTEGETVVVEVANLAPVGSDSLLPGSGAGLVGIRERVGLLGGQFSSGTAPDVGWLVTAILPWPCVTTRVRAVRDRLVTRVLIVDDESLVRAGLRMILQSTNDIEVVGEAEDGSAVPDAVARHRPDVVLMDIRMPRLDGLAATRALAASVDSPRVIAPTTFDLDNYVFRALEAGAAAFLLKATPPRDLLHAVRVVAAGEAMLSQKVTRTLIGHFASDSRMQRERAARERIGVLTDRVTDVFRAVDAGLSNAEIGRSLFKSEATVKAHVSRLLAKLSVGNPGAGRHPRVRQRSPRLGHPIESVLAQLFDRVLCSGS